MPIVQPAQLLETPEVSPLALLQLLLAEYDKNFLVEDFDVVLDWVEEDFTTPHELVEAKMRALRTCNATAAPWDRFEVFAPVLQAFNGIPVKFDSHTILAPHEVALGIYVMNKLRTEVFGAEPSKYTAATLQTHGLFFVPIPELSIAREYLRPYNEGADSIFQLIRLKPLDEIEVDEGGTEGVQAVKGRAELEVYKDTLELWMDHQRSVERLVT
jgi:hypothetical protein